MKQNKPNNPFAKLLNNSSETRLVYSSDGSHLLNCKKCAENPCVCDESPINHVEIEPTKTTLKIRVEKNQRGGKTVTVIFDLPNNPPYFEDLTKKLKATCGSGGTFKNYPKAQIEIQGDHRLKAQSTLEKIGFKVKLAGG